MPAVSDIALIALIIAAAMARTGAARLIAEGLVAAVGQGSPYALLAGLSLLTAKPGQLIGNTAAAANSMGIPAAPVLASIAVAAAAAFLTPIATPTNPMVMRPGGYAFGDYRKPGLPLMAWFFRVAVFLVPMVSSF